MSAEREGPTERQVEEAGRRLDAASTAAAEAERRAAAEIEALEADLARIRAEAEESLQRLKLEHEERLQEEREAGRRATAAAEQRLGEIEAQVEAAEERVAAAERRAGEAEAEVADAKVRARESAAAWLRQQLDALRNEAERR